MKSWKYIIACIVGIAAFGSTIPEPGWAFDKPYLIRSTAWLRMTYAPEEEYSRFTVDRFLIGGDLHFLPWLKGRAMLNVFEEQVPYAIEGPSGEVPGYTTGVRDRWRTRLEDLYFDFVPHKFFGLRAGLQSVPFGLLDLWTYPTIAESPEERIQMGLYPEEGRVEHLLERRDLGVVLHGAFPGGYGGWEVGGFQGPGFTNSEDNRAKDVAGSVKVAPAPALDGLSGLFFRLSWYEGKKYKEELTRRRQGVALVYEIKAVTLAAEAGLSRDDDRKGRWASTLLTFRPVRTVELATRADWWDPDSSTQDNSQFFWTAGLNWHLFTLEASKVVLQFAYDRLTFEGDRPKPLDHAMVQLRWDL